MADEEEVRINRKAISLPWAAFVGGLTFVTNIAAWIGVHIGTFKTQLEQVQQGQAAEALRISQEHGEIKNQARETGLKVETVEANVAALEARIDYLEGYRKKR